MKIISDLSDIDLCEAMRCCAADDPSEGCDICPCGELRAAGIDCAGKASLEAARRLDHLTAIRAERDALKKQLRRMGVQI